MLIVGPSGAGKDTVLSLVRCGISCGRTSVTVARRTITRASDGTEQHDTLDQTAFDQAVANGAFSLWWSAHGNSYGISATIDDQIREGKTVLCNVSRTIVATARDRYVNVSVVLITAPDNVLRERLAARQRRSDGDLETRVARGQDLSIDVHPDVIITNVGPAEVAAAKLLDVMANYGRVLHF